LTRPGPKDLINFYGPKGTIKRMSLFAILAADSEMLRQELGNKLVLVGFQSITRERGQMDKDEYEVPVSDRPMFGAEIHATIAANLIDHSWLRRFPVSIELCILYTASLLMGAFAVSLRPEKSAPVIACFLASAVLVVYRLFAVYGYWIPGLGALLIAGFV